MEIGPDLDREYESHCSALRDLGPVVEHLTQELLRAAEIRVHSVRHRVKARESVERKISRKDSAYERLTDVHDLLGIRVITFFPDEVDQVAEVVESEFIIDEDNSVDKRALLDPDRFGYLSRHYVASLNEDRRQLTEHARFDGCCFEIQIRSILQHAWAEIEHDLGYHSAGAIPDSVRRRFSRLAGLLEIADDEFQTLRNEVADYQAAVDREVDKAPESVPIDQDSITALIKGSKEIAELDSYIAKALGTEIKGQVANAGILATRLQRFGLTTIAEVVDELRSRAEVMRSFVSEWVKRPKRDATLSLNAPPGISIFYLIYLLVAESENAQQVENYLVTEGIGPTPLETQAEVAKSIVDAFLKAKKD